jgi:hypothetical protein
VAVSRRCRSTQVVDESWQGQFSGQLGMLPARVTLSLYFFQETRDKKKLVASLLKLHSYHDPRPEGRTTKDGETLIRPKDLSPPACCIIQRHPTKCQELYMDENGREKTMMIPALTQRLRKLQLRIDGVNAASRAGAAAVS